jgi:hypothetical protein
LFPLSVSAVASLRVRVLERPSRVLHDRLCHICLVVAFPQLLAQKLRDHLYRTFGVAASHDGAMEIAKEEIVFAKRGLVRKSLRGEG